MYKKNKLSYNLECEEDGVAFSGKASKTKRKVKLGPKPTQTTPTYKDVKWFNLTWAIRYPLENHSHSKTKSAQMEKEIQ